MTQDGSLTVSIAAGAIPDQNGVPNAAFTETFITDITSIPYPTPLAAQNPPGSLIYDPTATGTIGFVGDTDSYTLSLAGGQGLSVTLQTDAGLTGTVTVTDPSNHVIGSATVRRRRGDDRAAIGPRADCRHLHDHRRRRERHDRRLHDPGRPERGRETGERHQQFASGPLST